MTALAEKTLGAATVQEAWAFAHPVRRRILEALEAGAASPVSLTDRLGDVSLGTVAYHVRMLVGLGMLELVGTRQRRGATEHIYRLAEAAR